MRIFFGTILAAAGLTIAVACAAETGETAPASHAGVGVRAYSMLTHDGRRLVSHVEGTNTVYELVPTNRLSAALPPVREWKLYGLKATHTDIGLHNSQYIQRHGTVKRIDEAAQLIDADSRADDDPAAYRYVMEGFWFWDNYHQDKGMDAAWRIVTNYVARGRMDVGVTCAGNHTHLFSGTEIERSTLTKRILAEKWGIGTKTFIMADNPGISCSVITPYSRAGIKYGLFLPNQWNPIPSTIWRKNESISAGTWNPDAMGGGARVEVSYDSPLPMVFRWKAPGGDESLLMWCSTQYGHGFERIGIKSGARRPELAGVEKRMPEFLGILEEKYPYDIWMAATYGDDETPNTAFADFAAEWNAKWAWPQFRTIGRLDEPFEYLEKNFGDKIPTLCGEMTSGWLQHAASTPELLADKLNADRMLETAERLGTFAGTIDRASVDRAWWYLILNDEHSYGTSGYQGRRVFETWMQHRDWIERAAATASNELAKAVAKLGLPSNDNCSQITNTNSFCTSAPLRLCVKNSPVKDGVSESRWYRVVVTNGIIYSIYDKDLKRELIDAPANRFLYTRDNHKTWETNPETALGAKVTRRVYLPDDAKRIDIVDTFEHARDLFNSRRYYRYGYLAFPFSVPGGRFAAHLNGTVVRPYEDCHPMTSDAYCAVRDWCAVENDDFGVALMMRDSTLTEFGEIHPDKTCYTGKPPKGKTAIYPYIFTDWLQMHQPDGDSMNFTFRFSITSYESGGQWAGWAHVSRVCEEWLDPYAKWMRENNVPRVSRETVAEPPPGWTGLIEKPRAGHGEKDGQMYVLWGAEMSPDFDHYELYRDGKFLANVTNEVYDGIPYRVARYEDLDLPTRSRHEYQLRKVWKDGRRDALCAPFSGLTRFVSEEERNGVVCEGEYGAVDRSAMSEAYWKIWDAAEETRIDKDIEANRRADGAFAVPAPDGTEVEVEQICHEFRFGANIFNFNQLGSAEKNERYKAMFGEGGLFNQATVPFYWREYEPAPGVVRSDAAYEDSEEYWNSMTREEAKKDFRWRRPAPAPIIGFCRERGIATYGHVLVWGATAGFPDWMWYHCCPPEERFAFLDFGIADGGIHKKRGGLSWAALWKEAFAALGEGGVAAKCPKFAANMRDTFRRRVEGVAARFGDVVDSWECTNESWQDWVSAGRNCRTGKPLMLSGIYGIMPGDYQLNALMDAKAALPESAKLNINDNKMCPEYRDMIKDLIANGAKIDVVGCQMHVFNTNSIARLAAGDVKGLSCAGIQPWTPESIRMGLDLMAGTGRPLHVSEITIPAPGVDGKSRMIQAMVARNFYRACFSHKATMGITWWNTVDGGGYAGEPEVSGLLTKDMERKPVYDVLDELINHEWKTKCTEKVNGGRVAFRGFRGKYRLSWNCRECGQRHSRHVVLTGSGVDESSGVWTNVLCRPTALSFRVDGMEVSLASGETMLDLKTLYPNEVVKGRDGKCWATVEFDIVAPHDGKFVLEMHNDYYGELSVNGGTAVATKGPYVGYAPHEVVLRKGANHVVFRTRSGSGGNWSVGFRMPRNSGAKFNFGKN